jgi:hypothetical protein
VHHGVHAYEQKAVAQPFGYGVTVMLFAVEQEAAVWQGGSGRGRGGAHVGVSLDAVEVMRVRLFTHRERNTYLQSNEISIGEYNCGWELETRVPV